MPLFFYHQSKMSSPMTLEQRKVAIEKITSDWVSVVREVEAESAEQNARDKRRFSGEPSTVADKAYKEAFKAFVKVARAANLCIDERDYFVESGSIRGLQEGIAHCREKIRRQREERKADEEAERAAAGLAPKTWAEVAGK